MVHNPIITSLRCVLTYMTRVSGCGVCAMGGGDLLNGLTASTVSPLHFGCSRVSVSCVDGPPDVRLSTVVNKSSVTPPSGAQHHAAPCLPRSRWTYIAESTLEIADHCRWSIVQPLLCESTTSPTEACTKLLKRTRRPSLQGGRRSPLPGPTRLRAHGDKDVARPRSAAVARE